MSNYQPGEGTTAARLIAALHEAGGSLTPARASEVLGVPANNIGSSAKAAVKSGLVCYFAGGRGKSLWHLPGAGPNTTEAAAPATAKRQKRKKRSAAPPQAASLEVADQAPVEGAAIAALWDDGDVVLAGIAINADAASVTLSDQQARRVHRFLERVYGPTA